MILACASALPRVGYPGAGKCQTFIRLGRQFDEPIELPDGRKLVVLPDAASYVTAQPKKESAAPEWRAAIEALMLVVYLALSANQDKFTAAPASKKPAGGCRQAYRA